MEKAQTFSQFQELLKIHTIKRKFFFYENGQCASLSIHTEKKNKAKKNKQKKVENDINSKTLQ